MIKTITFKQETTFKRREYILNVLYRNKKKVELVSQEESDPFLHSLQVTFDNKADYLAFMSAYVDDVIDDEIKINFKI